MNLKAEHRLDRAAFFKTVKKAFGLLFSTYRFDDPAFTKALRKSVRESLFLFAKGMGLEKRAEIVLEQMLFFYAKQRFPKSQFRLTAFIEALALSRLEKKQLLIALLNETYFGSLPVDALEKESDLTNWLIQLMADKMSFVRLKRKLLRLSLEQKIGLIGFVFKHYREGSYFILQAFDKIPGPLALRAFIEALQKGVIEAKDVYRSVDCCKKIDEKALDRILKELQGKEELFYHTFDKCLHYMIESPMLIETIANQSAPDFKSASHQAALVQKNALQIRFDAYFQAKFDKHDFKAFLEVFGLYGQLPYVEAGKKRMFAPSLIDKLHIFLDFYTDPFALIRLSSEEVHSHFSLIENVIVQLKSLKNPQNYVEGLRAFTCAIPTCAKVLSKLAGVTSVLKGMQALKKTVDPILDSSLQWPSVPIFIYDQSPLPIFKKNQDWLSKMMCEPEKNGQATLIHLSSKDCLEFAKRLDVEDLLQAPHASSMGFGGARNAVFLLTPLLKQLFCMGKTSVEEMLHVPTKQLRALFEEHVLLHASSIFMIDDDMEIPAANLFSHALFAKANAGRYCFSHGFCRGRATKYRIAFRQFQEVIDTAIDNPSEIFDFAKWIEIPFSITMGEYMGKPKICLNLPFGQEEAHFNMRCASEPLLHVSYHLGGPRYPCRDIPSNVFSSLHEHLQSFLPYAMGINLSMDLIDPSNEWGKCALPWNDKDASSSFNCLKDVFTFACNHSQEMQRRFWRNVLDLFDPVKGASFPLRQCLQDLMKMDVPRMITEAKKTYALNRQEIASLTKIARLYLVYQQDALLFWEFGSLLIAQVHDLSIDLKLLLNNAKASIEKKYGIDLKDYRTTHDFFILCHSLGTADFCDQVQF